jgi:AcrR family transcriptional regulator
MSTAADRTPRTARGTATRDKILAAAEKVFAQLGYTEASIVRITEEAGVGQGTFYLYFESKLQVFEETVEDLNRRVRHAMSTAAAKGRNRIEAERLGFEGFFAFTAEHPALYRIVRESEFVSPRAHRLHYSRIVEGYVDGLTKARDSGEVAADPLVAAWALMGIGEMVGMRWVIWGDGADAAAGHFAGSTSAVPAPVLDEMMRFIQRGLGSAPVTDSPPTPTQEETP